MKIEKLNDDKIKITLSVDDLAERNIDIQSFIYNSPESQDMFWDMMQEAEQKYGFNVDESMIYVEASSAGAGIFTLTVTKTTGSLNLPASKSKTKLKKGNFKLKRKVTSIQLENSIYIFSSFDDICEFCNAVDCSKIQNNSLYKLNEQYYLKVSNMPFNSILEFATLDNSPELTFARIQEYGSIISEEEALQKISLHFTKKKKRTNKKCS